MISHKVFLFRVLEFLRREPFFPAYAELKSNELLSSSEIAAKQNQKLAKIIGHARETTPYYAKQFIDLEKKLGRKIQLGDFSDLKILTKDALRENANSLQSSSNFRLFQCKTSGSTGKPLKFHKSYFCSAYSYAAMYRGLSWHGVGICDPEGYLWGIPLRFKDRCLARARDYVLNRYRNLIFTLGDQGFDRFLSRCQRADPVLISGYSTFIYEFSRFLVKKNLLDLFPRLKIVKYTAESMSDYQASVIENALGVPVVSEYGSAETGIISFQCPHGGHHVASDCIYLEFVKDDVSGLYKVIVTNLNSYGFPLLRYDTGDLVVSPELKKCSCGLPFPVMDKVIGRVSDVVYTADGNRIHSNIFSYITKELVAEFSSVNQMQYIQKNANRIQVKIALAHDGDLSKINDFLCSLINQKINSTIEVELKVVDSIPRDPSGKLRYFIQDGKYE